MEFWRLFAHSHWFTLNFVGKKIRICARCAGYFAGFSSLFLLSQLFSSGFSNISSKLLIGISISLLLPLIFDWITQSWGLRESSNGIRFISGVLFGLALFLFLNSSMLELSKTRVVIFTAMFVTTIGLLGKKIKSSNCC